MDFNLSLKNFFKLTPAEREAIDNFAFAQSLLQKGGDAERRFALICLDSSIEVILRAYLLKLGIESERVNSIVKFSELFRECENRGLIIEHNLYEKIWEIHNQRNEIYHGKTVIIPSRIDLWSKSVESLIVKIANLNPMEYFKSRDYERVSLVPEDLNYIEELERKFRKTPPYVKNPFPFLYFINPNSFSSFEIFSILINAFKSPIFISLINRMLVL